MCELCELVKGIDHGETKEEVLYNDRVFVAVYCKTHPGTPMAVVREHTVSLTQQVLGYIYGVMGKKYSDRIPRGTGMTSIKDHWHEHWVLKEE